MDSQSRATEQAPYEIDVAPDGGLVAIEQGSVGVGGG